MNLTPILAHNRTTATPAATVPLLASVDYNLRVVVQEAMKFTRHANRTRLMPADVTKALRLLNAPPSYTAPSSRDPLAVPLAQAARDATLHDDHDRGHHDDDHDDGDQRGLWTASFTANQRVSLRDLKRVDLPRLPLEPALVASWLAVEGHPTGVPSLKKKRKRKDHQAKNGGAGGGAVVVDPGVYHAMSHQQRKLLADLLSKITPATAPEEEEEEEEEEEVKTRRTTALRIVSSSAGLQPLLPYFIHHITTTIHAHLKQLPVLRAMLHFTLALLVNHNVDVELYLDQLLPCIFSCLVGKKICRSPLEDHWPVRDCAAVVLSTVRFIVVVQCVWVSCASTAASLHNADNIFVVFVCLLVCWFVGLLLFCIRFGTWGQVVDRYSRKYPDLASRIMNTLWYGHL